MQAIGARAGPSLLCSEYCLLMPFLKMGVELQNWGASHSCSRVCIAGISHNGWGAAKLFICIAGVLDGTGAGMEG